MFSRNKMKFSGKISCAIPVIGLVVLYLSTSSAVPKTKASDDCRRMMGRIAKKTLKTFSVCTKEVKANSTKETFDKKMSCIIKCSLDKLQLLDSKGIVTKDTIQDFMHNVLPNDEGALEMAHGLTQDCLASHGAVLDASQPFCETYGHFAICMQNVMGDFAEKVNCSIPFG